MVEIINTQITANADFSGLLAQVKAATTELSALQKQIGATNLALSRNIRTANTDFAAILGSSGQFTTQFVTVSKDVEKFGKNLDAGRLKLKDYYRTWQDYHRNSNSMVKELAKQQVALQNSVLQPLGRNARGQMQFAVNIPTGIDELKNKTKLAQTELSIMNKVMQDGSLQLINWGKNTQWAGRQLTVGLTVPMAAFGKAAADAFRMADQELTRLTKVYGGLAATSSQELQKVRSDVTQTAREIASTYGVSFKETISLAADIAATGQQGDQLLGSLKETTRLAVLGEVDRQEAMKATLAIQNAFKQNTSELAESINFLNAVENQTSTTLQDLVEAIPKAGPIVRGLGGSVQDLALYLTAMKEGGIDAASAANGLKSAFGSLINPTKVAKGMFADFGIDLEGLVTKNAGNLTQTILALQGALDTLNPLQKQQALEQLFGKYQFARMGALFDNLGKQGSQTLNVLDLMAASTKEIGAIAERELTMVTESASGRYRRAIEGLRADLAQVGEGFLNIATKIINIADGVINFFNKLPEPVKKFLGLLGGFTAITGPIIMLTGVFANFIGYVFKGLSHLRNFFSGAKGFKLLTPEMIAADAAAENFAQSLYSDAAAATSLKGALDSLRHSIVALNATHPESIARVIPGGRRGMPSGTGGSGSIMPGANLAHFIAQARMSPQEFENQTFFHSTPYLGSINQGWGQRPQTIGVAGTPMVEGITSLKGASTLVDPTQYARYATMMTLMAGKTKKQLDDAIMILNTTGKLPVEFLQEIDDIFPAIERIAITAGSAAKEVATKASKGILTAEQAVLQIEAANRTMLAELESFALSRGISPAALRMVPGTNQQIISRPRPGAKPTYNMKSAFRENRGGQYTGPIATETGVPLDPAAYQFRNMGGAIYMTDGNTVPGPNINADVVPAMLTPGEFVLTRGTVAREGANNVQALHEGRATIVPFKANIGGSVPPIKYNPIPQMQYFAARMPIRSVRRNPRFTNVDPEEVRRVHPAFRGRGSSYQIKHTAGSYISDITDPSLISRYLDYAENGVISRQRLNELMLTRGVPGPLLLASIRSAGMGGSSDQFLNSLVLNKIITAEDSLRAASRINRDYENFLLHPSTGLVSDRNNPYWNISRNAILEIFGGNRNVMHLWNQFSTRLGGTTNTTSGRSSSPISIVLNDINNNKIKVGRLEGSGKGSTGTLFAHASAPDPFNQLLLDQGITMANMGGMIPGYNGGGMPKFTGKGRKDWITYLFALADARRKFIGPLRRTRSLINDDPAHGPLQIGHYWPEMRSRLSYLPPTIRYNPSAEDVFHRGMDPSKHQVNIAWPVGSAEERAQYIVDQYVRGGYDIMRVPNAAQMLRAAATKRSGKFYRGTTLPLVSTWSDGTTRITPMMSRAGTSRSPFPDEIVLALDKAKRTGDYSELIGKRFIMSRSSWSSNPQTARGFGDFFIESDVNNRRMVPMSEMTPGLTFDTPKGKVAVDESEFYFGGEFEIISVGPNGMKLKSIPGAVQETRQPGAARLFDPLQKREMGGPTQKGKPYLVGEKGPELFVPDGNGRIVPNSQMVRFARRGQVGRPGKTEFSDYQVRGTSPRFTGMPYLPTTVIGQVFSSLVPMAQQVFSSLVPMAQQYSAAIKMSAENISKAYYNAGQKYIRSTISMQNAVSKGADLSKTMYAKAGVQYTQAVTAFGTTLQAAGQAVATSISKTTAYIQGLTIASMRVAPETWGELLFTRKGLLRPKLDVDGQPMTRSQRFGSRLMGRPGMTPGMGMGSNIAMMGGSMLMMSGMSSGNKGMTIAGGLLTAAPLLQGPIQALGAKLATSGRIAFTLFKTLKSFSIPGAAITAAAFLGKKLWDGTRAAIELSRAQAGIGGIKTDQVKKIAKEYKSLSELIGEAKKQQDLYNASAAATAAATRIGGKNLTLTAGELTKGVEEAKKNKDTSGIVAEFQALTKQEDINKLAESYKRAFIAGGKSVEEATNAIYTFIYAAGKAQEAALAIGSKGFGEIQSKANAATGAIKALKDTSAGGDANAVTQSFIATSEILGNIGYQLTDLDAKQLNGLKISQSQKNAIEEQLPLLKGKISVDESYLSVLYKIKLAQEGIKFNIDSQEKGLKAAYDLLFNISKVTEIYAKQNLFKNLDSKVKEVTKAEELFNKKVEETNESLKKQRKVIEDNYKKEKEAIQKKIDLINEEADAKLKSLELTKDQADYESDLQQATLEYQNAIATGNQSAAASAMIRIEEINRNRQFELSRQAIEENRAARIKELQPALDKIETVYERAIAKIEKIGEALSNSVTKRSTGADKTRVDVSGIETYKQAVKDATELYLTNPEQNAAQAMDMIKDAISKLPKELQQAALKDFNFGRTTDGKDKGSLNLTQGITEYFKRIDIANKKYQVELTLAANAQRTAGEHAAKAATAQEAAAKNSAQAVKNTSEAAKAAADATKKVEEGIDFIKSGGSPGSVPSFLGPQENLKSGLISYKPGNFQGGFPLEGQTFVDQNGQKYIIRSVRENIGPNGITTKQAIVQIVQNKYSGGQVKHYGPGGNVFGPGTTTSDSIPAMLSNGEYVIKASAVNEYGVDLFDSLNAQKLAKGGYVKDLFRSLFRSPTAAAAKAGAVYMGLEQGEKYLSLKYGADKNDSSAEKWAKALGRVAYNTAQGGLTGLVAGKGIGGLFGVGEGLVEGLVGLGMYGSQYGVKGGSYATQKGFDPNKQIEKMTLANIATNVAAGATVSAVGQKILSPIISKIVSKVKEKTTQRGILDTIDDVINNKSILPQEPNSAKQADFLANMYKDYTKFWQQHAQQFKDGKTIGQFNANIESMKNFMTEQNWKDIVKNIEPKDFVKSEKMSPFDKEFFDIVNNSKEGIEPGTEGLQPLDLYSGMQGPDNISVYDFYMAKAAEFELISELYKKIGKIIRFNPSIAKQLGIFNPKYFASGGLVELPKYAIGGAVSPTASAAGAGAVYMGLEQVEKYLSLKYGADKNDSSAEKWAKALGRVAYNTAQGGLTGLVAGKGIGGLFGLGEGLIEGLAGLVMDGSQYGVKGGKYATQKGFNPNKEIAKITPANIAKNMAAGATVSAVGQKIISKIASSGPVQNIISTINKRKALKMIGPLQRNFRIRNPHRTDLFSADGYPVSPLVQKRGVENPFIRNQIFSEELLNAGYIDPNLTPDEIAELPSLSIMDKIQKYTFFGSNQWNDYIEPLLELQRKTGVDQTAEIERLLGLAPYKAAAASKKELEDQAEKFVDDILVSNEMNPTLNKEIDSLIKKLQRGETEDSEKTLFDKLKMIIDRPGAQFNEWQIIDQAFKEMLLDPERMNRQLFKDIIENSGYKLGMTEMDILSMNLFKKKGPDLDKIDEFDSIISSIKKNEDDSIFDAVEEARKDFDDAVEGQDGPVDFNDILKNIFGIQRFNIPNIPELPPLPRMYPGAPIENFAGKGNFDFGDHTLFNLLKVKLPYIPRSDMEKFVNILNTFSEIIDQKSISKYFTSLSTALSQKPAAPYAESMRDTIKQLQERFFELMPKGTNASNIESFKKIFNLFASDEKFKNGGLVLAKGGYINPSMFAKMSLPVYHDGGKVMAPYGQETLALLQGGEYVIPKEQVASAQYSSPISNVTNATFNFTFDAKIHPEDRKALINDTISAYKQQTEWNNVRMGRQIVYNSDGGR